MVLDNIPSYFKEVSNTGVAYLILHGLFFWLVPSFTAFYLYCSPEASVFIKVLIIPVLCLISAAGALCLALCGHEGFHGNMNKNYDLSVLIGIAVSSIVPFYVTSGFYVYHWQHHQYTNTEKDPDYVLFNSSNGMLNGIIIRMLFGSLVVMALCYKNALYLIFSPSSLRKYGLLYRGIKSRIFTVLNFVLAFAFVYAYYLLFLSNITLFVFLVVIPFSFTSFYYSIGPILEHAGTSTSKGMDSRTFSSVVYNFLVVGYGYHNIHHLCPSVPQYRLKSLHKYMTEYGLYPKEHFTENSAFEILKIGFFGKL